MTENIQAPQTTDIFAHKTGPVEPDAFYKALWEAENPIVIGGNEGENNDVQVSEPPIQDIEPIDEESPVTDEEESVSLSNLRSEPEQEDLSDARTIPKKRLNKEIEKRKALEEQLNHEREERIRAQTELGLYNKAIQQMNAPKEMQQADIDPVDQDAHNLYMRELNILKKQISEQQNTMQQSAQMNQFTNAVNAQQAEFIKEAPDFEKAYSYLIEKEQQNAVLQGIPESRSGEFVREKLYNTAQYALSSGRNVAEMIYEMSRNMGYSSKAVAKSVSIATLAKNHRASADATREVPSVSTKLGKPQGPAVPLQAFENIAMNTDGRGVNNEEFYRQLAILERQAKES